MSPASPNPPAAVLAILPARIGSSRLPRKVLLNETGRPLFVHSAQNVSGCAVVDRVVVATDSEEVRAAGQQHDVETVLTRDDHPSGTDRVLEAMEQLVSAGMDEPRVVLNVQADEPDLAVEDLEALVAAFDDPDVQMATLATALGSEEERAAGSVVKVVCASNGDALYFSRAAIPSDSHPRDGAAGLGLARRHIGVYAFRPAALRSFCSLPPAPLELQENLEQLRWLESGGRLRVLPASRVPRGIDTRADYDDFVTRHSN